MKASDFPTNLAVEIDGCNVLVPADCRDLVVPVLEEWGGVLCDATRLVRFTSEESAKEAVRHLGRAVGNALGLGETDGLVGAMMLDGWSVESPSDPRVPTFMRLETRKYSVGSLKVGAYP